MIALGKTEKMIIKAYKDPKFKNPIVDGKENREYSFQINPETYNHHYKVQEDRTKAACAKEAPPRYFGHQPAELEFEILIDGTGVIKDGSALDFQLLGKIPPVDVVGQVKNLMKLCVDANGTIHRNNYLKVMWGNTGDKPVFKGTVDSLDLNYKLFKPDGTPLRVIAKLKLIEAFDEAGESAGNPFSSPDITHQRIFKAHDRFALLTYQIYDDPKYYFDIAKVNSLNSFRKIKTGSRIDFVPIK